MQVSIEISLYPLLPDYAQMITEFIIALRKRGDVRIETNGLSTQLFGKYETLMTLLKGEMAHVLKEHPAVFVLKVASGERTPENLPEALR